MRQHRFGRHQRLTRSEEFQRVFKDNRRSSDAYFTILGHNTQLQTARLGLAISRKHIKHAVGRNRIKRVVRESFRHHQDILQGWDLVVVLKRNPLSLSNRVIFENLKKHWHMFANEKKQHA